MKIQHVPFRGFVISHEGKEVMTFSTYEAALDYFENVLEGRTMPETPPTPLTDEEMKAFDLK